MREVSPLLRQHIREMERRAHRPASIVKRMQLLIRTEDAIGRELLTATTDELREFLDTKKLGASTLCAYISHWSAFWKWAIIEGHTEIDPTLRLTRPRIRQGLPRPVAAVDIEFILESAPTPEVRAMLYLASHAGLRCMEIAGLEGSDIMETTSPPVLVVAHGKGDKARVVPMSTGLMAALRSHGIPRHGRLFRKPNGDNYQPWAISHVLRVHLHECGLDASGHQLRHTFATQVYRESGGDLRMTQELMGHASPAATAIYTAWAQDKAAIVIDRLYGATSPDL
jgi:integrase/recombinase XerC